jgi:hypothetical protein
MGTYFLFAMSASSDVFLFYVFGFSWKLMNPEATRIHGTIKLHKQNKPVRPIVNWKNSPGYKTAKQLAKKLKDNTTT